MKNPKLTSINHIYNTLMVFISILLIQSNSLSVKLQMDTKSPDTLITSYYTDIGACSCNLLSSVCDVFCCCDTSCSNTQISSWTQKGQCLNKNSNIQRSCEQLNQGGFLTFEDLACVYYSNRGNINYFYSYPDSGSVNYPPARKFVSVSSVAEAINAVSSTATTDAYSSSKSLIKIKNGTTLKFLEIWSSIAGGNCGVGYVNMSQSGTFSCEYPLNARTCTQNTDLFRGSILLCKNGECSSTQSQPAITPSTVTSTTCNNMITAQTFTITVSSSGSSYLIDSITATITQQNVDFSTHKKYPIKTTILISKPANLVTYSGNPGYIMNKQVKLQNAGASYSIPTIADVSGNCLATGNSFVELLFGQNVVYSCKISDPCLANLYIDQLVKQQSLKLQKWARGSTQAIQVSGTSATKNTCNSQTIDLNILYSNAGWTQDMQNYIIGAQITTSQATQSPWCWKFLKINWIYVDPKVITAPPQNRFYQYFSYLWKPLRQYFGVY